VLPDLSQKLSKRAPTAERCVFDGIEVVGREAAVMQLVEVVEGLLEALELAQKFLISRFRASSVLKTGRNVFDEFIHSEEVAGRKAEGHCEIPAKVRPGERGEQYCCNGLTL